jgi:hypothetical protein
MFKKKVGHGDEFAFFILRGAEERIMFPRRERNSPAAAAAATSVVFLWLNPLLVIDQLVPFASGDSCEGGLLAQTTLQNGTTFVNPSVIAPWLLKNSTSFTLHNKTFSFYFFLVIDWSQIGHTASPRGERPL